MTYIVPRRRVNPALYKTYRACGQPQWKLVTLAGLTHQSQFSALICAKTIPATDVNIERLQRIADAVKFPREQLFLFDERTEQAAR